MPVSDDDCGPESIDPSMFSAAVNELDTDSDQIRNPLQDRLDETRAGTAEDAREFRRHIVWFTLAVVGCLVIAATTVMGVYLGSQWGKVNPSVPVAYFASVVIESIGILYVITQHLFPNTKK